MRGVNKEKIHWEEDLKPFTRLPREEQRSPRQPVAWWIPAIVSLLVSLFACNALYASFQRTLPSTRDIQSQIGALLNPTPTKPFVQSTSTPEARVTATPYVAPTNTPPPVPTAGPAGTPSAEGFAKGGYARVTGGNGLNVRKEPSVSSNPPINNPDGVVFEIIGGPVQADGYTWWQLKKQDGSTGWGVQNFLTPTSKPAASNG